MKLIESGRASFSIGIRVGTDCPEFTEAAVVPVRLCQALLENYNWTFDASIK